MNRLTKAEEEIMQIIWELGSCTVGAIRDYMVDPLGQEKPPHSTVSTIVRILHEKGFLDYQAHSRTFVYSPIIKKDEYSKLELTKLLADYFDGSPKSLVSFLVKQHNLSISEINELVKRLENPGNKKL